MKIDITFEVQLQTDDGKVDEVDSALYNAVKVYDEDAIVTEQGRDEVKEEEED